MNYSGTYDSAHEDLDADGYRHAREPDRCDGADLTIGLEPGARSHYARARSCVGVPLRGHDELHARSATTSPSTRRSTCAAISAWRTRRSSPPTSCRSAGRCRSRTRLRSGPRATPVDSGEGRWRLPLPVERLLRLAVHIGPQGVPHGLLEHGAGSHEAGDRSPDVVHEREARSDEPDLHDGQLPGAVRQRHGAQSQQPDAEPLPDLRLRLPGQGRQLGPSSGASPTRRAPPAPFSSKVSSSSTARSSSRGIGTSSIRVAARSTRATRSRFATSSGSAESRRATSTWNPDANLLLLVSGATAPIGFTIENNSTWQGAIYVVNDFSQGNSVIVCGPVIAQELVHLQQHGQLLRPVLDRRAGDAWERRRRRSTS